MNRAQFCLWMLLLGVASPDIVLAAEQISIEVEAHPNGGGDALATMYVPNDWRPFDSSAARVELLAPDGRSRVYLRAMPGKNNAKGCAKLAKDHANQVIASWGGPPKTKVASKTIAGPIVDFELRRLENEPTGEVIWSRVQCETGALIVASCTVPIAREWEMKDLCAAMLSSIQISSRPKPTATALPGE